MADYDELIARAERAIRDAQDFTDDKKPSLALTLELLAAVKDGPKRKLRITGPNSDGEYWLHMDGNGRRGGINLGASHGPIVDSLLEAFSETPAAREAGQAAQPVAHVDGRSYRKKPVVVKAVQWTGENLREVIAFTDGPPETKSHHAGMMWEQYEDLVRKNGLKIYTLEGKMDASPGDWIIKGVKGEFYPCKPDIFAATYDPANQPTAPVVPAARLARASVTDASAGWTLGFEMLQEFRAAAGDWGYSLDLEAVEQIALAVEARLRSAPPVGVWPDFIAPPKYENPCEDLEDPRLPDFRLIWETARALGYAIGLHGSMKRDCDLIAAPWVDNPAHPDDLIKALCVALNATQVGGVEAKPVGRIAVILQIDGYVKHIDLSIMPAPPVGARVKPLVAVFDAAQAEAHKAMRKFPQPNYVISKVAEEAGEVVKAAIHCAENRETKEAVLGEVVQCMAMLIRLCLEGDQVHGLAALLPAGEGE